MLFHSFSLVVVGVKCSVDFEFCLLASLMVLYPELFISGIFSRTKILKVGENCNTRRNYFI